ncbi:MAG: methionyl-tRNA formyltransferase [Candidatus Omnitrophota bacterium]
MNIIFLGSDSFAIPALIAIHEAGYDISCVVTQPDRKKGRGLSLAATPVKSAAAQLGLGAYQPGDINFPEAALFLKGLKPDLSVVVAYGQILSQDVLSIPAVLTINLHASLLPKYRGAAPINWALINQEKTTGVTVIKVEKKMDAGAIITQEEIPISKVDDVVTLEKKLSQIGAKLLTATIKLIESNKYKLIAQDNAKVSLAPKLKRQDGLICWEKPAFTIDNLIKGTLGWPGAFTYYKGKMLKILKAEASNIPGSYRPGEIVKLGAEGIIVATGSGCLMIKELQFEAGKRLAVKEFISGHKISAGDILG